MSVAYLLCYFVSRCFRAATRRYPPMPTPPLPPGAPFETTRKRRGTARLPRTASLTAKLASSSGCSSAIIVTPSLLLLLLAPPPPPRRRRQKTHQELQLLPPILLGTAPLPFTKHDHGKDAATIRFMLPHPPSLRRHCEQWTRMPFRARPPRSPIVSPPSSISPLLLAEPLPVPPWPPSSPICSLRWINPAKHHQGFFACSCLACGSRCRRWRKHAQRDALLSRKHLIIPQHLILQASTSGR